jgi:hypothetical protein
VILFDDSSHCQLFIASFDFIIWTVSEKKLPMYQRANNAEVTLIPLRIEIIS